MLPLPFVDSRELRPLLRSAARRVNRWTLDSFNPSMFRRERR
jgi:hypothetical protein